MRPFTVVSVLLALAVQPILAAPTTDTIPSLLLERATAPPPCKRVLDPAPTANETAARFTTFVQAFVGAQGGKKNITKAFEFIAEDYINHNPMASNGAASAWSILSPIWQQMSHTYLRSTIKTEQTPVMSWVNYRAGGLGEVVDRFRWEGGCIVEHWDQGEKYPSS
ncbi:hypothetical protein B0T20DRAFT_139795 [Sordaria brevicollis]|uniref:SnoaL-like domain-containing protein n=1 Tax=Sordaria brevicollis TaxID=83679 RepID=A0AAE0PM21_SORBR|nr:hypothetical protein B0T20DRAFT_139795 [Sordaria brevicollis]